MHTYYKKPQVNENICSFQPHAPRVNGNFCLNYCIWKLFWHAPAIFGFPLFSTDILMPLLWNPSHWSYAKAARFGWIRTLEMCAIHKTGLRCVCVCVCVREHAHFCLPKCRMELDDITVCSHFFKERSVKVTLLLVHQEKEPNCLLEHRRAFPFSLPGLPLLADDISDTRQQCRLDIQGPPGIYELTGMGSIGDGAYPIKFKEKSQKSPQILLSLRST